MFNHHSFTKQLILCTRRDPEREYSILPSVIHTLNLYQVYLNLYRQTVNSLSMVSVDVSKMGVLLEPGIKVNGWTVLLVYFSVTANVADDSFVFQQDTTPVPCTRNSAAVRNSRLSFYRAMAHSTAPRLLILSVVRECYKDDYARTTVVAILVQGSRLT